MKGRSKFAHRPAARRIYRPRLETLETRSQPSVLLQGGLAGGDASFDDPVALDALLADGLETSLGALGHRRAPAPDLGQAQTGFPTGSDRETGSRVHGSAALAAPVVTVFAPSQPSPIVSTQAPVWATAAAGTGSGWVVQSAPGTVAAIRHGLTAQVTSRVAQGQGFPTPSLAYSTYRGATGPSDADNAIRVKASTGEAFVVGFSDDSGTVAATVTVVSADGSSYVQNEFAFAGANFTVANSIDLDGAGNVYIAGTTDAPGNPVAFVSKFDPSGSSVLWTTTAGSSGDNAGNGVRVDVGGRFVYLTGSYDASVTGGNPMDLLVAKLSTVDGSTTGGWSRYYDFVGASTVGSGVAFTFGGPRGSLTYTNAAGPHPAAWFTPDNGSPALVEYYFTTGSMLGAATDVQGNLYTTGYELDPSVGPHEALLVTKFRAEPQYEPIWGRVYANPTGNFQGNAIAVDGDGATAIPYVAGFKDSLAPGTADAVVLRLTATGYYNGGVVLGGSSDDAANGLDLGGAGSPELYVAGRTASTDFPTTMGAAQTIYSGGVTDGFVSKIAASG